MTLCVLLLFLGLASAKTLIYEPLAVVLSDGDVIYIGKVGPGYTIRIIMNTEYPTPVVSVESDYPITFTQRSGRGWVEFNAPTEPGTYHLLLAVKHTNTVDRITVSYDVVPEPLIIRFPSAVSAKELSVKTTRGYVLNPTVGYTYLRISCPMCTVNTRFVPPKDGVYLPLTIRAGFSGLYNVPVRVKDLRSGDVYEQTLKLRVEPSLPGRVMSFRISSDFLTPIIYPIRLLIGVIFWTKLPPS